MKDNQAFSGRDLNGLREGLVVDCYEDDNEPSGSIKTHNFLF